MPYKCPLKRAEAKRKSKAKHLERYKQQQYNYTKTPKGRKKMRLMNWKLRGIEDEDLGSVYDYYLLETNCMICNKEYKSSRDRHLDHDHDTGEIRYICCQYCNTWLLRKDMN